MKKVLMLMTVSFLSLSVYGQWGSGWGDDDDDSGDDSSTETTTEEGSESSGSEDGSTSTELTVPTIGTHYDDAPDPRYEPTQTVDDGRPLMEDGVVVTPPFLREADVKFKRRIWRRIDVRQKLNKAFTWPRNPVIKNIYELAVQGKVKAYLNDSLATYYTPEDAWQRGSYTDVIEIPTPGYEDDPTMNVFKEVAIPFVWEDIKQIELMEDWIFDYKHSELRPRIIAVAPIYTRQIGGLSIDQALFWLDM
ncbi:MAG: hypothetical protein P8N54_08880, partial [Flavobacteriales bacterium]|nr:hypothetical protein [Flavobacteriales bacterium]